MAIQVTIKRKSSKKAAAEIQKTITDAWCKLRAIANLEVSTFVVTRKKGNDYNVVGTSLYQDKAIDMMENDAYLMTRGWRSATREERSINDTMSIDAVSNNGVRMEWRIVCKHETL